MINAKVFADQPAAFPRENALTEKEDAMSNYVNIYQNVNQADVFATAKGIVNHRN